MATLKQLEDALVKADVAGNVDDARILAAEIRRMRAPKYDGSEYGTPADDMGTLDRLRAGAGKSFYDVVRALGQPFGLVSQDDVEDSRQRDAALMDTGAGMTGNILGTGAILAASAPVVSAAGSALLPASVSAALPAANTLGGAALYGALEGAALTPGTLGERAMASGAGAVGGAGGVLAGRLLNSTASGARALFEPFSEGGRERIAARALQQFSDDPVAAARRAANAVDFVPGSTPTLAEASRDVGLSRLQNTMASDPLYAGAFAARNAANRQAAVDAIGNIAQDAAARDAAIAARRTITRPLYAAAENSDALVDPSRTVRLIDRIVDKKAGNPALTRPLKQIRETLFEQYPVEQRASDGWKVLNDALQGRNSGAPGSTALKEARTVMHRLRSGAISADDAARELSKLQTKGKAFTEALESAKQYVKTPDWVVRQNPSQIASSLDYIDALLKDEANTTVKRELMTIKNSLGHQMRMASPEYGQAEKLFAQMSAPVNQMDVGRALKDKLAPAARDYGVDRLTPDQFFKALKNGRQTVKEATGLRSKDLKDVLTSDQLRTAYNVARDLGRRAQFEQNVKAVGSPTAQNFASQNLVRRVLGPLGAPENFVEGTLVPAMMAPARLLQAAYNAMPEQQIKQAVVNGLLNKREGARLLELSLKSQPNLLQRSLEPTLSTLGRSTAYSLLQ